MEKEELNNYLLDGQLDVEHALSKILIEEINSVSLGIIEDIPNITEEQKINILLFKHNGHTILEWENKVKDSKGINPETGHPTWYEPQAELTTALTLAKILYLTEEQLGALMF
jgi:hypothetical protein